MAGRLCFWQKKRRESSFRKCVARQRAATATVVSRSEVGRGRREYVFSAAERGPQLAQGAAATEGQAELWDTQPQRIKPREGRQKRREGFCRPSRGLVIIPLVFPGFRSLAFGFAHFTLG